jgi:beta-lactamase superfamily II metal-dependent hydrolase
LRILIDCGSIAHSTLSMRDIVGNLIDDVRVADGTARIDVIVCTHRHADHVSGFDDARWKDVQVGEVWFPWTESPTDPEAKRIREWQRKLAVELQAASRKLAVRDESLEALAVNALSNHGAMTTLHSGFKGDVVRRFLGGGATSVEALKSPALLGVKTYVLGPSRSEAVIRDMTPPAGKSFLNRIATNKSASDAEFDPFGPEWAVEHALFEHNDLLVDDKEANQLKEVAEIAETSVAVALDKAVNGTSLVLVFEVGNALLFFPGDAQWGTWNELLSDPEARELVARATLLKIGHHGSHNATPRDYVTYLLQSTCCAMLSTRRGRWKSIPRQPLLDALDQKKVPLARSDGTGELGAPFVRLSASLLEASLPL